MKKRIASCLFCAALSVASFCDGKEMRLDWQTGDRWTVETVPQMSVTSDASSSAGKGIRWSFEVTGTDKIHDRNCWRASIRCAEPGVRSPEVEIWVDQKSGMLIRTTSRVKRGERTAEFTETYLTSDGQPTPVLGMLSSLPLDMPIFNSLAGRTKSLEPQIYETVIGNGKTKSLEDLGFASIVSQNIKSVPAAQVKSLNVPAASSSENVNVEIRSGNRTVRQIWAPGKPWPIFSDNGVTHSRLLEYIPANSEGDE